jgi:hypothetical protein
LRLRDSFVEKKNKERQMPFDKGKFVSDFTASGMEEAQAELLAKNQADMLGELASKQDIADLQNGFQADQTDLRQEFDDKISEASDAMRREVNEQVQKTRLLIDDVQCDARKTEARLEGVLKQGFAAVNHRFNVLAASNTAVIVMVMVFMYLLMRR